jgi:hypothetical protein
VLVVGQPGQGGKGRVAVNKGSPRIHTGPRPHPLVAHLRVNKPNQRWIFFLGSGTFFFLQKRS